jgi:hypothetical protein
MITGFEHFIYMWTDYDHRFRALLYIRGQIMIADFEHCYTYIRGQIMIADFEHCYIYVDRL